MATTARTAMIVAIKNMDNCRHGTHQHPVLALMLKDKSQGHPPRKIEGDRQMALLHSQNRKAETNIMSFWNLTENGKLIQDH